METGLENIEHDALEKTYLLDNTIVLTYQVNTFEIFLLTSRSIDNGYFK